MNLSSVIPGANSPGFVNSQLVCLLPVGILNWGEGDFNMILKSPFRGVVIMFIYLFNYLTLLIFWPLISPLLTVELWRIYEE